MLPQLENIRKVNRKLFTEVLIPRVRKRFQGKNSNHP